MQPDSLAKIPTQSPAQPSRQREALEQTDWSFSRSLIFIFKFEVLFVFKLKFRCSG